MIYFIDDGSDTFPGLFYVVVINKEISKIYFWGFFKFSIHSISKQIVQPFVFFIFGLTFLTLEGLVLDLYHFT